MSGKITAICAAYVEVLRTYSICAKVFRNGWYVLPATGVGAMPNQQMVSQMPEPYFETVFKAIPSSRWVSVLDMPILLGYSEGCGTWKIQGAIRYLFKLKRLKRRKKTNLYQYAKSNDEKSHG